MIPSRSPNLYAPASLAKLTGLLACCSLLLAGCIGIQPQPLPTAPPPGPETPTATIQWFPATNTSTPIPTVIVEPTPGALPGLGESLLTDPFDDPSRWTTARSANASAIVERDRLTLTITGQTVTYLFSLRVEPILTDFLAEVTVNLSLCRGRSQYGILFRVMGQQDYYRYAVNCQGEARLERVRGGAAFPLQDWIPSADAPPGAPADVRIGVWAAGSEMRFTLNGKYQFSVRDPVFHQGTLGLFILSSNGNPVTAGFQDLSIRAVSYVSPTPALTPSGTPTPSRTPVSTP
ncbi:MAG: hypothetical protein ABIJ39_13960 [Chloroflexota bacterium]